jgi:hypothetical protein
MAEAVGTALLVVITAAAEDTRRRLRAADIVEAPAAGTRVAEDTRAVEDTPAEEEAADGSPRCLGYGGKTKRGFAPRFLIDRELVSIEMERHVDEDLHGYWMTVLHCRLEAPLRDRLYSFLIQPHAE